MNQDIVRVLKARDLEKRILRIGRIWKKKKKELNAMQDSCKHEITVFLDSWGDNLYEKCLFCGEESAQRRHFEYSTCIDVSNYESENYFSRDQKFEIVKNAFVKCANENPELSSIEIAKLVQTQLDAQNEKFEQLMKRIYSNH